MRARSTKKRVFYRVICILSSWMAASTAVAASLRAAMASSVGRGGQACGLVFLTCGSNGICASTGSTGFDVSSTSDVDVKEGVAAPCAASIADA